MEKKIMDENKIFQDNLDQIIMLIKAAVKTKRDRNNMFQALAGVVASAMNAAAIDKDLQDFFSEKRISLIHQIHQERSL